MRCCCRRHRTLTLLLMLTLLRRVLQRGAGCLDGALLRRGGLPCGGIRGQGLGGGVLRFLNGTNLCGRACRPVRWRVGGGAWGR